MSGGIKWTIEVIHNPYLDLYAVHRKILKVSILNHVFFLNVPDSYPEIYEFFCVVLLHNWEEVSIFVAFVYLFGPDTQF